MSEQLLKQIFDKLNSIDHEIKKIRNTQQSMATKSDIEHLEKSIEKAQIDNIAADELLLQTIKEIKGSVQYVNRRIADTELELHTIKSLNQ